jgi:hypothetical protein
MTPWAPLSTVLFVESMYCLYNGDERRCNHGGAG